MTRTQQPVLTLFAVGMIGLGILGLIYGDFAMVWQPVAAWVPGRTALAYLAAALMLAGGMGLLFERTVRWAVRLLFVYCIVWALLKVPAARCGAADRRRVAGLWRAGGAAGRRMDVVCAAGRRA